MSMLHDPSRQVNYLQQCLSQDKRSIGFFLAAGCPVSISVTAGTGTDPLIPDVQGLTEYVASQIRTTHLNAAFQKVENHLHTDGHIGINIESQLSLIRGLKAVAGTGIVRDL